MQAAVSVPQRRMRIRQLSSVCALHLGDGYVERDTVDRMEGGRERRWVLAHRERAESDVVAAWICYHVLNPTTDRVAIEALATLS